MTEQPTASNDGSAFHLPAFSRSFDRDSFTSHEDEDSSRHGSLSERRPSRLSQLLLMQEKKRKQKKYRDKQGFVWRRMIPDELPTFRVPNLTLPINPQEYPGDPSTQNSIDDQQNRKLSEDQHTRVPPNQGSLGGLINQSSIGGHQTQVSSGDHQLNMELACQQKQTPPASDQNINPKEEERNHIMSIGIKKNHDSIDCHTNLNSVDTKNNFKQTLGTDIPDKSLRAANSQPIQDSTACTSFRGGTNPTQETSFWDSTDNLQEPFQTPQLVRLSNQVPQGLIADPDSFLLGDPGDQCGDSDSCSIKSENSFQTCSSEPQLQLVPRQVSDNYKNSPSDREARKASFKALQGKQANVQNNLLNSFDPGAGPKENKPQNMDNR